MENVKVNVTLDELVPATVHAMTPAELFKPETMTKIVEEIKRLSLSIEPDLSTGVSRNKIKSLANKVARSKTFLDNAGKTLVSEWKTKAKAVDVERKRMRFELDVLKELVRKPLTDWEVVEEARREEAAQRLIALSAFENVTDDMTSLQLANRIKEVLALDFADMDTGKSEIEMRRKGVVAALDAKLLNRTQYEKDQAEIAKLREEKALRDAEDRRLAEIRASEELEAQAAAEAAQRAKDEADKKAKAEAARVEREKQSAIENQRIAEAEIERLRQQKINDVKAEKLRAEEAERKRLADIAFAEKKERERMEAQIAETQRIDAAKKADQEHRIQVDRAVVKSLCALVTELNEIPAQRIVAAAAAGEIPGLIIDY